MAIRDDQHLARAILRAMRPKHWVKNLLLFVPLITGHELADVGKLVLTAIGFAAFSLCASAAYILNDLTDLEADREHPHKRQRPFAAGHIPAAYALPLAFGLLVLGFVLCGFWLPSTFALVLALYVAFSSAYSLWLKKLVIIDVVLLSVLYAMRVAAGGLASDVVISQWLLTFALFIFTSLAFAKRYSELVRLSRDTTPASPHGRNYRVSDIRLLECMGAASGFLAVLVLALYIHGDQVNTLYEQPQVLWMLCPLLLYWVARLWLVAARDQLAEDPIAFAVTDPASIVVAVLAGTLMVLAATGW